MGEWTLFIKDWKFSIHEIELEHFQLLKPELKISTNHLKLHIEWFSWLKECRFLEIQSDRLFIQSIPKKQQSPKAFEPLNIHIPAIPWSIYARVNHFEYSQAKLLIQAQQIQLWHDRAQNAEISLIAIPPDLHGITTIPAQIHAQIDWSTDTLKPRIHIAQGSNRIQLYIPLPKQDLDEINLEANLEIKNPRIYWSRAPHLFPDSLVLISHLRYGLADHKLQSHGALSLATPAFKNDGMLPALKWQIDYQIHLDSNRKMDLATALNAQGQTGQKLRAQIRTDLKHTSFQIQSSNWYWKIASFTLPLNIASLNGELKGTKLSALLQTPEGSKVQILGNLKPLSADLIGEFSDREPWIYTWTGPMLQLRKARAKLHFSPGWSLKGDVFAQVENSWSAYADSAKVQMDLNAHQIQFPKIQVFFGKNRPYFNGFVNWGTPHHVSMEFKTQRTDSMAQFRMQVPGEMEVLALNYPLDQLPLHFLPASLGLKGSVNGQLSLPHHGHMYGLMTLDGKRKVGSLEIPWKLSTILSEDAHSYQLKQISLHSFSDQFEGSMTWLKDPKLSLLQKFSLIEFSNVQLDLSHYAVLAPLPISGSIYGNFKWQFLPGELSPKVYSKIHFAQLGISDTAEQTLASIPSALLEIDSSQNFQFQGLIEAGHSKELSGKFHTTISPLFPSAGEGKLKLTDLSDIRPWFEMSRSVKCTLSTSLGGLAHLDLHTSSEHLLDSTGNETDQSIQKLTGLGNISGPWTTPVKNLEIPRSNVYARIDWTLNGGIDSLFVKILRNQIALRYPNIPDQNINISGNLKNQLLNLDLLINDSTLNKFNISTQYDLKHLQVNQLYGYSPQYILRPSPDHSLGLFRMEINHSMDESKERFPLSIDSAYYRYYDLNKGLIRAEAKADLALQIPKASGDQPSLSGNLWINKAIYENNFSTNPDLKEIFNGEYFKKIGRSVTDFFKHKDTKFSSKSKDLALDLNISDRNSDSLLISTKYQIGPIDAMLDLPLAINMKVGGSIHQPLLLGSISNNETGKLAFGENSTPLSVQEMSLIWNSSPIERGLLEFNSIGEMKLCEIDSTLSQGNHADSVCSVNLELSGPIDNTILRTSASCNTSTEMNTSNLLVSMALEQCLSDNSASVNLYDKLYQKVDDLLSRNASKYIKKSYFIEKINFDGVTERFSKSQNRDSAKVDLQLKLPWLNPDKFKVKGGVVLSGENTSSTDNTSTSNSYGYVGLDWILWQNKKKGQNEMLLWESSGLSKNASTQDGASTESNFALRTGLTWQRFFWDFCLFGIGNCKD